MSLARTRDHNLEPQGLRRQAAAAVGRGGGARMLSQQQQLKPATAVQLYSGYSGTGTVWYYMYLPILDTGTSTYWYTDAVY